MKVLQQLVSLTGLGSQFKYSAFLKWKAWKICVHCETTSRFVTRKDRGALLSSSDPTQPNPRKKNRGYTRLRVSIPVVDEALAQAALTRKGSKQDLTDDRLSTDRRAGGRATPISQPRWIFFEKDKDGVQTTTSRPNPFQEPCK
ncbi:hypothetical protein NEUTE2DRAFT_125042 [Neurospora tetrasperma FGSC 2509]|nr:hypothetical protein NEUTE2DRAFT_125042 [Neurospora tetrasperma FGSC 2509]